MTHPHRPGTDAGLLAPTWAGLPVEAELTDEAWLRAMADAEVALVRAQAAVGVAPPAAADAIARAAEQTGELDLVALARQSRAAANPVVAFVPAFTALVRDEDPAAAEYVHRGSTSQDILDTATMLIAARVLTRIGDDLERTADAVAALADRHRRTLMAGRTLTQHAVPTTFGLKAAGWLTLVDDALGRCRRVRSGLPAELGGAAGTMSAYQEYARLDGLDPAADATALLAPYAKLLGLAEPTVPWHVLRTPILDVGTTAQLVTGALGKIALDVQTLSRTEIGELTEPAADGRGASSAMPQKRNPVLATLIITAARQVPAYVSILAGSMLADDERPGGAWHAEWQPLREVLRLAGGAAATAAELTAGLIVHPDRMRANVELTRGAIVAERLTVALAPAMGKAAAKALLGRAARTAAETGEPLGDVLARLADLEPGVLRELLDPAEYTGPVDALIDRALRSHSEGTAGPAS
jgi:3-carboxy-cis,cis-muconate cycloisomerase